MKKSLVLCAAFAFLALVDGQCTGWGNTCLSKSDAGPGLAGYYNGGPGPCFLSPDDGNKYCFVDTDGDMAQCDCDSNAACQCGSVQSPGSQCTLSTAPPANCQTLETPYCNINKTYTACKVCGINAANCGSNICQVGLTSDDIALMLGTINQFRQKVANGSETRGNPGPQPGATNMNSLVWDADLAYAAQTNVYTCLNQHDRYDQGIPNNNGPLGQNLAADWNSAYSATKNLVQHITMWYNEVTCMPKTLVSSFGSSSCTVGHYTQLVWANTQRVGCGWVQFYNATSGMYTQFTACNFSPAGNYLGQAVYSSTAACPTGKTLTKSLCQ